jgi:Spy/CpxP family protein refolding chaperone
MKLIVLLTILASLCPLFAADDSKKPADPFAEAFFPPELVLMARDRIGLTQEQEQTLRTHLVKTRPRSDEKRAMLDRENAALAALVKQERVDEAMVVAQLDKVLAVEREAKHLHVGLAMAIKNLLTPEQQSKLREVAKAGVASLSEEVRRRLTEKVERVQAGAHQWAENGRDPGSVLKSMEEKFKPLMESGKVIEAEAELDRVLEQLLKGDK